MAKVKAAKAPREVRRNVPSIDLALNITRISVTTIICLGITFLATWLNYVVQNPEAEIYNVEGMMKFIDKNINFMSSYIVCAFILWAAIGFVLATLLVRFIKYCLNYK
jgi:hypothetical protein